jgi:hypothetical protein
MQDVALPRSETFSPGPTSVLPSQTTRFSLEPYRQHGGGILVQRVNYPHLTPRQDRLWLGLSRKNGSEWGELRWLPAEQGQTGLFRLDELLPGTYRVLRIYQPSGPLPLSGRWQNSEVTVQVRPGEQTSVPALEWVTPPKPAPGGRDGTPVRVRRSPGRL